MRPGRARPHIWGSRRSRRDLADTSFAGVGDHGRGLTGHGGGSVPDLKRIPVGHVHLETGVTSLELDAGRIGISIRLDELLEATAAVWRTPRSDSRHVEGVAAAGIRGSVRAAFGRTGEGCSQERSVTAGRGIGGEHGSVVDVELRIAGSRVIGIIGPLAEFDFLGVESTYVPDGVAGGEGWLVPEGTAVTHDGLAVAILDGNGEVAPLVDRANEVCRARELYVVWRAAPGPRTGFGTEKDHVLADRGLSPAVSWTRHRRCRGR